jgi:hypothetical protein
MLPRSLYIIIPLLFSIPPSLAESIEVNIPNEVSVPPNISTKLPYEIPPSTSYLQTNSPIRTEQLDQSQIINQIYKQRANRITKFWKRPATPLAESANVRVYLDEQGKVKDILLDGQFSDAFALSIKTAIYKAAPFKMPEEQALKKQLQEIRIHFSTE